MNKRRISFKLSIIKGVTLVMIACYILSPIRQEISTVLHAIWHTIEMPNQILNHDYVSRAEMNTHDAHEHEVVNKTHEHKSLSFINDVINGLADPFSSEVPLEKFTHHKHINEDVIQYHLPNNLKLFKKAHHPLVYQKIKKGHLFKLKEPPQFIS